MQPVGPKWQGALEYAIQLYLDQTVRKYKTLDECHIVDTPKRVVKAFESYTEGCAEDPTVHLKKQFENGHHDQMIHVTRIQLISLCAHHLAPIFGKIHFAYIPDDYIVGLSKISRFIRVLSRRPQVQEHLSDQIVDVFYDTVQPKGCGVLIRAYHGCMMLRGIMEPASFTISTALRGVFKASEPTRLEFLQAQDPQQAIFP